MAESKTPQHVLEDAAYKIIVLDQQQLETLEIVDSHGPAFFSALKSINQRFL
ncbi:MAG: hypothetical protein QF511_06565 [Rhodospirillales bacterium]|jgi:hypothetical protein|nr:hypothetical protein [Rhodospirillales bacterium]HIJ94066.1 hypothetical protein [Rhodospirillaceae bacterium]